MLRSCCIAANPRIVLISDETNHCRTESGMYEYERHSVNSQNMRPSHLQVEQSMLQALDNFGADLSCIGLFITIVILSL